MCPCRAFYEWGFFLFFSRDIGVLVFVWDVWVLRDPRFPAKKKKEKKGERLGRGTLNTCAKFQGLISQKRTHGVFSYFFSPDMWVLVFVWDICVLRDPRLSAKKKEKMVNG